MGPFGPFGRRHYPVVSAREDESGHPDFAKPVERVHWSTSARIRPALDGFKTEVLLLQAVSAVNYFLTNVSIRPSGHIVWGTRTPFGGSRELDLRITDNDGEVFTASPVIT